MKTKLINLLTMCRKAGKAALGFDPMKEALASGKAVTVFVAQDISPKTEKEVRFFAAKTETEVIRLPLTQDELHYGVGKKVGVITVCDKGFAEKAALLAEDTQLNN